MPRFSTRRATLEDLEELLQLRLKLFYETGDVRNDELSSDLLERNRSYVSTNLPTNHFISWIAEAEGRMIGISGLVFFEKPPTRANSSGMEAYVMNMYTLPEWRGTGVATALLQDLIAFVRSTPARRIWLHTTEVGRSVYEQCGFTDTSQEMELVW